MMSFSVTGSGPLARVVVGAMLLGGMLVLGACSDSQPVAKASAEGEPVVLGATADQGRLVLRGALVYRSRMALDTDSQAVIQLRDMSADVRPGEAVIAEQRFSLNGRQVPVEFALELSAGDLAAQGDYQLRASLTENERTTWISEPIRVQPQAGTLALGEITLMPYRAAAFRSVLECGRLQVSAGYEGDTLVLDAEGKKHQLLPVKAASGARFEAEGDPDTRFWSKGDRADLIIAGKRYPLCVPPGDIIEPFIARGNEPFWRVDLNAGLLSLSRLGEDPVEADYTQTVASTTQRQVHAQRDGAAVEMVVTQALCRDSMTGMPYPQEVEVRYADERLHGCGGDPLRLLQGVEWIVEDINEAGIIDRSHVTLNFSPDGRLFGQASCNNYRGDYELTGEGLILGNAAATRKACAPALMEQEQRVLATLEAVRSFDFTEDGALVLYAGDGRSLTARTP